MGMAVYHLLGHAVHHVGHGEAAPLGLDLGVENDLHQHVSQFLAHGVGIVSIQSVQHLISLLQEIPPDRLVGLLRFPQDPHDLQKVLPVIMGFILKIYHTLPFLARNFREKSEISRVFSTGTPENRPVAAHFKCRSLIIFSPWGMERTSSARRMRRAMTSTAYTATPAQMPASVAMALAP